MIRSMAPNPIIFAMANPDPEITPEEVAAIRDDAIVATGRSDYPNQVNNVLGFPYIFRGALDVRATTINEEMKIAAAQALAALAREDVPDEVAAAYQGVRPKFGPHYIIPVPFDPRLLSEIPAAVAKAAMDSGVARKPIADMAAYKMQLSARRDPIVGTLQRIFQRVRRAPKRVVFAEGEEEQMIRAAASFVHNKLGTAILIGREETVRGAAERAGIDIREGIEIHNARLSQPQRATTPTSSTRACSGRATSSATCQRLINNDRNHFGACMVALGDADAMVSGVTRNYSTVLDDVRRVIDPKPGHRVIGVSIVLARGRTVLVADTAVHDMPTAAGARRHRRGGGRRRAAPRLHAARRDARLFDLRPAGGRARQEGARGGRNPRPAARRFRVRRRDGGRRRAQPEGDGGLSVLPPVGPGQRAGHAGLPLGGDLDQDAAGTRRLDGDRPAARRPRQAGADRLARRRWTPTSSTWRRSRHSISAAD